LLSLLEFLAKRMKEVKEKRSGWFFAWILYIIIIGSLLEYLLREYTSTISGEE
jgi:hypothetical protein